MRKERTYILIIISDEGRSRARAHVELVSLSVRFTESLRALLHVRNGHVGYASDTLHTYVRVYRRTIVPAGQNP